MEAYLRSSIRLAISIKTSLAEIEEELSNYPNLSCVQRGSTVKYLIAGNAEGHFFMLAVSKNELAFETYSIKSPLYFINEALAKLFVVLENLSKHCSIDMSGILPYLVIALSKPQVDWLFGHIEHLSQTRNDEVSSMLAKRILLLEKELEAERAARKSLESALQKAVVAIIARQSGRQSIDALANLVGLERNSIEEVLKSLPRFGYFVTKLDNDAFEVAEA